MLLVLSTVLAVYTVESLFLRNIVSNVSAVTAAGNLGVYWDSTYRNRVSSINWGNITAGSTKTVTVYVRNEGNDSIVLVFTPTSWNPSSATLYLYLSGSYDAAKIVVGQVVRVTLALRVSPSTNGISAFSFNIVFEGRKYYVGDINRDGIVDLKDCYLVGLAYGSTPDSSDWNPYADLNNDRMIDLKDVYAVTKNYGLN
jgi:hypothetical protein